MALSRVRGRVGVKNGNHPQTSYAQASVPGGFSFRGIFLAYGLCLPPLRLAFALTGPGRRRGEAGAGRGRKAAYRASTRRGPTTNTAHMPLRAEPEPSTRGG